MQRAESDDPAQESEPAGKRLASDCENTRWHVPELPGRVQGVASTLTRHAYSEHGRQCVSCWSYFGNWLCLAVICEVKSAVGALGCQS